MFIPTYSKSNDRELIFHHLSANPMGIITNSFNGRVEATHLPFVIEKHVDEIKFISHYAKRNPQWQQIENNEVLVIFQGPDAYISPSNYEKKQNVPTWDYTTVHVRGKVRLIEDLNASIEVIEKTILRFEPSYFQQWKELDESYKMHMMQGLVSFELQDITLEAMFKLSQNKTKKEVNNIINDLSNKEDLKSQDLSNVMKDFYEKNPKALRDS